MKKIFLIACALLCCEFILAQTNNKDTVMWFVGRWTNNKTFVIDSNLSGGSGGGTVTMQPGGSLKVNTPNNKQWNDKIDKQVDEIDKVEEKVKNDIRQEEGLVQYNLGRATVKELERIKEEVKNYKAEPTKEEKEEQTLRDRNKQFGTSLNNWCVQAKADFNEVMNFLSKPQENKARTL